MKRSPIPTILTILLIVALSHLKNRGQIQSAMFFVLVIGGAIVINLLYYKLVISKKVSGIRNLREKSHLLNSHPEQYLEEVDAALSTSVGYEKEYLVLHKANILSRIQRNKEAIETLRSIIPVHLDKKNRGIYYSNLLGLYVQEGRIEEAEALNEEQKDLLDRLELDKTVAHSVLTNRAALAYKKGQKEAAATLLDQAYQSTKNPQIQKEILAMKEKHFL